MVPGCFSSSQMDSYRLNRSGGASGSETRVEAGWSAAAAGVFTPPGTPSAPRTETHKHTHTRAELRRFVMLNNCRSTGFLLPQTSRTTQRASRDIWKVVEQTDTPRNRVVFYALFCWAFWPRIPPSPFIQIFVFCFVFLYHNYFWSPVSVFVPECC